MKKIMSLFLMLLMLTACDNRPERINLVGTYRQEGEAFADISFYPDGDNAFYFYINGETELGTFSKNDDGTFTIHSESFDGAIVELSQDDSNIFVTLDEMTYTYEQLSHIPTIREQ